MTEKRLSTLQTARHRRINDRLTRCIVSAGGLLVLLALLLMFFYLLYAVLPLFRSPAIEPASGVALPASSAPLAWGADESLSWGYGIDKGGLGRFIPLRDGETPSAVPLMADFSSLAAATGGQPLYIMADRRGNIRVTRPVFSPHPAETAQWTFPFGEGLRALSDDGLPLRHLTLAQTDDDTATIAAQSASGEIVLARIGARYMIRRLPPPLNAAVDGLSLSADGRQLYVVSGTRLSLYQWGDDGTPRLREQVALAAGGPVEITPLPADGSLLVRDSEEKLTLWSDVPAPGGNYLTAIRRFTGPIRPGAQIMVSPQRPLFGVLAPNGDFSLFSARESSRRWSARLLAGAQAAFAPREAGIVAVDGHGWHSWRLSLGSPEVSWRTLTQKVWYGHYPAPAWTWQSTSADGRDSGKFSLVPLLAGTLKAAGYAMLFATPLALAAAMYTAWFMAPVLRRWVKPAMEIMGAVPSVIIGLIAGVWLAPHVTRMLSGVLLLPLVLPAVILAAGWGISRLPAGWRNRFAPGWDCLVLLPLAAFTVVLMCRLSPWIDRVLFGVPLSERLGEHYNPMNALVVGIAMGFALIPLMFSLAEDALFNVPVRLVQGSLALGATPWQTLLGVTLPTAGAGLFSALILGLGRAIGETMIVLMASGNMPRVDGSLFQGLRALAANIAIEIPEAAQNGDHYRILLLTALVLFVFTFLINTLAEALRMRLRERYRQQDGESG